MTPLELRTQRKALGLSQAALAHRLGCSKQAVHFWETGKRPIPGMLELAMWALVFQADAKRQQNGEPSD